MITNNSEAISVSSAESISESESEPTTESAEPVDSAEEALGIEIVSSTGSTTTYAVTGNAEDNSLTLTATGGDSWISVEGDGATIDAKLIADGSTLETEIPEGTSSLVIIIGNTPATEINLNGEDVPYAPEAENSVRQEIEFQFE